MNCFEKTSIILVIYPETAEEHRELMCVMIFREVSDLLYIL